jgi:hypothetical protein
MGKKSPEDAGRRRRIMFRAFALMLAAVLLLPLVPYAVAYVGGITNPNPGADLWRQVRQREAPPEVRTQVQGVDTSGSFPGAAGSWAECWWPSPCSTCCAGASASTMAAAASWSSASR